MIDSISWVIYTSLHILKMMAVHLEYMIQIVSCQRFHVNEM
ncbi:protein of unknown function [Paenibacillus alvei]|uniref:Uncharacterized protein n=1 Tax=Paenibacillus alvei TaxID=44250 RepID=A0A383RGT6_PAEAL|nr:protein of unknown function [Paenibacillus alvei]